MLLRLLSSALISCSLAQFPLYCGKDVDLLVTVVDDLGRSFDNFSSLLIDWTLSDQSLATFTDGSSVITDKAILDSGKRQLKS